MAIPTLYELMGPNMPKYGTPERTALAVAAGVGNGYTGREDQNAAIVRYLQGQQRAPIQPQVPVKTQEQIDSEYAATVAAHPAFKGNTPEALTYAMTTGDLSALVNENDKPFTIAEQQKAVEEARKAEAASFEEEKAYDKQVAEAKLRQKQLDYQNYLATSAVNFQTDKTNLDQTAANQGVLFSGGRAQKQQALQSAYETEGAYKKATLGGDISGISRDYQYAYGSGAGNDLSSYYNQGGNTYDPNVATGGVGSSGLSSVYNAGPTTYQGTTVKKYGVSAQQRAAGLLWNKGNKMVTGSIKNQYKP